MARGGRLDAEGGLEVGHVRGGRDQGALADPVIAVHGPSGELLGTNDNWNDAPKITAYL